MAKVDKTVLDELQNDCLHQPHNYVASKWIIERIPSVFQGDYERYIKAKLLIADIIKVDSCSIIFVGSSATGFSLNPAKDFKMFDEKSDVDIAIISQLYFDEAWSAIRSLKPSHYIQETQDAINDHVNRLIYWGTIATDKILGLLPFAKTWIKAQQKLATLNEFENREINFRLYKDHESLRAYHLQNIHKTSSRISYVKPQSIKL